MPENSEIAVLKANRREVIRSMQEAEANHDLIRTEYKVAVERHSLFYGKNRADKDAAYCWESQI